MHYFLHQTEKNKETRELQHRLWTKGRKHFEQEHTLWFPWNVKWIRLR